MVTCTILPNGNLKVTAGNEARSDIARGLKERGYWSAFADAFESYSCNGYYTPFDAGDGNPFVGLTSAPCIAESMDCADDGARSVAGRLWYFPDYCLRDPLQELARKGATEFELAP